MGKLSWGLSLQLSEMTRLCITTLITLSDTITLRGHQHEEGPGLECQSRAKSKCALSEIRESMLLERHEQTARKCRPVIS